MHITFQLRVWNRCKGCSTAGICHLSTFYIKPKKNKIILGALLQRSGGRKLVQHLSIALGIEVTKLLWTGVRYNDDVKAWYHNSLLLAH